MRGEGWDNFPLKMGNYIFKAQLMLTQVPLPHTKKPEAVLDLIRLVICFPEVNLQTFIRLHREFQGRKLKDCFQFYTTCLTREEHMPHRRKSHSRENY